MARDPRAGRVRGPGQGAEVAALVLLVLVPLFVLLAAWASAALAAGPVPMNPMRWALVTREWATLAWVYFAGILLGVALLGVGLAVLFARAGGKKSRLDHLARKMSTARDQRELTEDAQATEAERLGVDPSCGPGLPLGESVSTGKRLASSWEWTQIWVMGTRAGKTSCVCIPQVVATGGPVVATSNKRDIVDATRGPRSERGPVWVHDPQQLAEENPTWWWSPVLHTDTVERADEVASLMAAASRSAEARSDAYFDTAAQQVLSSLFLAAHHGGYTVLDIWDWITDPEDKTPELSLRAAGFSEAARFIRTSREMTAKQRDGVYGSMMPMMAWTRSERVRPWVTPATGDEPPRREFKPAEFVATTQTLYLLSKEGAGSARALTACLTVAVCEAAERLGVRQGGRLSRPMAVILDEAANVCRWPSLPDVYSHYGSRGIVITTILQSWAQGVDAWGKEGMAKMWSAANVRGVGRGIAQDEFASSVSKLIGDHERIRQEISRSRGHSTVSPRVHRERIMDEADVAALPGGRAVLFATGTPAVLLKLRHWSQLDADTVDAIEQSTAAYQGQVSA